MKKLVFYIAIVFFVASCAPKLLPTDRKLIKNVLDFRNYNKEGFFISTTPYVGLYDPLGEIKIVVYPATEVKKGYASEWASYPMIVHINEDITTDELLKIIVDESKKLGADGLVNAKIDEQKYILTQKKIKTELSYYKLSWLAIKRK